jgi:hypothetical protein
MDDLTWCPKPECYLAPADIEKDKNRARCTNCCFFFCMNCQEKVHMFTRCKNIDGGKDKNNQKSDKSINLPNSEHNRKVLKSFEDMGDIMKVTYFKEGIVLQIYDDRNFKNIIQYLDTKGRKGKDMDGGF